jgi:molybdenum cofactor synthesis domain-containing protein
MTDSDGSGATPSSRSSSASPVDGPRPRTAFVLTASDRSAAGRRDDASGAGIAERLEELGFTVERSVVGDEQATIEGALRGAAEHHPLIVTTGGTGLTPRDVTPQATLAVVDYEVPGLAEAMRADGRLKTPFASLSRGVVGVVGRTLVVNVPGSPTGALESLEAIVPVLEHAMETLAGPFDHATGNAPVDSTENQHAFGREVPPMRSGEDV